MIWMAMAWGVAPEGVDPDDLDRWEGLAAAAMAGPTGCWEFSGDLTASASIHSRAALWGRSDETPMNSRGTWSGRLEKGQWTAFSYRLKDPDGEPLELPVYPVVGEITPSIVDSGVVRDDDMESSTTISLSGDGKISGSSTGANPINLLRQAIDGWNTNTAFSNGMWSDSLNAVKLVQQVPVEDSADSALITTTTLFPGGGDKLSRMATVFPRKMSFGTWPAKVKVYDAQFHLVQQEVRGHTFPAAENMSAVGSALGFNMSYEQRLDYKTAQRCAK